MTLPRVYLAGPMSGYAENNYPAFAQAEKTLTSPDVVIMNPARNEELRSQESQDSETWAPWSWYMRQSLRQIADASYVVVLPGWEDSRGASLEVLLAYKLDIPVLSLDDWIVGRRESNVADAPYPAVRDCHDRMWFPSPNYADVWITYDSITFGSKVFGLDNLHRLHGPLTDPATGTQIPRDAAELDASMKRHPSSRSARRA